MLPLTVSTLLGPVKTPLLPKVQGYDDNVSSTILLSVLLK